MNNNQIFVFLQIAVVTSLIFGLMIAIKFAPPFFDRYQSEKKAVKEIESDLSEMLLDEKFSSSEITYMKAIKKSVNSISRITKVVLIFMCIFIPVATSALFTTNLWINTYVTSFMSVFVVASCFTIDYLLKKDAEEIYATYKTVLGLSGFSNFSSEDNEKILNNLKESVNSSYRVYNCVSGCVFASILVNMSFLVVIGLFDLVKFIEK